MKTIAKWLRVHGGRKAVEPRLVKYLLSYTNLNFTLLKMEMGIKNSYQLFMLILKN